MRPYGSLIVLIGFMRRDVSLWVLMLPCGSICVPIGPYACTRVSMGL